MKRYEEEYKSPAIGDTYACMINGGNAIKFHSECFVPAINRPLCISDCAGFCSDSLRDGSENSCKGFSIGKKNKNSIGTGCVLAMPTSDCPNLNVTTNSTRYGGDVEIFGNGPFYGFDETESNTLYQGDLIKSSNSLPEEFGFIGCYRKGVYKISIAVYYNKIIIKQ